MQVLEECGGDLGAVPDEFNRRRLDDVLALVWLDKYARAMRGQQVWRKGGGGRMGGGGRTGEGEKSGREEEGGKGGEGRDSRWGGGEGASREEGGEVCIPLGNSSSSHLAMLECEVIVFFQTTCTSY